MNLNDSNSLGSVNLREFIKLINIDHWNENEGERDGAQGALEVKAGPKEFVHGCPGLRRNSARPCRG